MSSSQQQTRGASVESSLINFWDDKTIELNTQRLKKDIPPLPTITLDCQVVRGRGIESLAYLILQILKTNDKMVVVRAIASACNVLFNDSSNFTGAKSRSEELTGLEVVLDETIDPSTVIKTNFIDAEDVTVEELLQMIEFDGDEMGAYLGVLFLAGNKKVTPQNRTAFNERRMLSATASIIGSAKIFVPDSQFLQDEILNKVYASFLSCSPLRANMTAKIVTHLGESHMGPALAFTSMFLLLVDSGMSALRIIKEAVIKHPWIRTDFPELKPELAAANEAQNIIRRAPGAERSFLKAIHGNAFVPVNYSDIDNLTGVCKEILKRTTPSYQNYNGGKTSNAQIAIINQHTDVNPTISTTVTSE
jgi:hypothetical protein